MVELTILNLISNETFKKVFNSPYLANLFIQKAKRSKKIRIISSTGMLDF